MLLVDMQNTYLVCNTYIFNTDKYFKGDKLYFVGLRRVELETRLIHISVKWPHYIWIIQNILAPY